MRVRWALEEVGQPYAVRLLSFEAMRQPAHRARHPFGQIPTYEQDGLVLFESGAIVLHIAQTHPGLLPEAPDAKLRAVSWMFAALNTIEPPVFERALCVVLERETPWFAGRLETLDKRVRQRELSLHLGQSPWLDGEFSAGDLLMLSVLLRLQGSTLLEAHPNLVEYLARGTARPAFQRAFEAQAEVFRQAQQAEALASAQASQAPPDRT
jgi:glutathione S-transferase